MEFKQRSLMQLAQLICGNGDEKTTLFVYRSSSRLTEFFQDCDTDYIHRGETHDRWVAEVLKAILAEPHPNAQIPPDTFARLIRRLMEREDARNEGIERSGALAQLAAALSREGFEPFYGEDKQCHLRHIATNTIAAAHPSLHRPFSAAEQVRRQHLEAYLPKCSEDELIEVVLLPLFRQHPANIGYRRPPTLARQI